MQFDFLNTSFQHAPQFFKDKDYDFAAIVASESGPFQTAMGCEGMSMFQFFETNGAMRDTFALCMKGMVEARGTWLNLYPFQERLVEGDQAEEGTFLVDLGGNEGYALMEVGAAFPSLAERLCLQDLPLVVEGVKLPDGMKVMAHDFFTPQPVKARAYLFKKVLHDWNDDDAVKILEQLKSAAVPGYSKLLINDTVAREVATEDPYQVSVIDICMGILYGSKERTQNEWKVLLEKAGMKNVTFFQRADMVESVIEADF